MEEDFIEKAPISEGTIRSTAKRRTAIKILMLLKKDSEVHTTSEVSEILGLDWGTASFNLQRLLECGFLETVPDKMDARTKYFRIADQKNSDKAIELYKCSAAFKLARFVPYYIINSEQLKLDKRFIETCEEHGFTLNEGISAVQNCPKINSEYHSNTLVLWRTEQGYDNPSRKPEVEEIE
jgi:DNA-binding MarR family transcriptional regulator